MSPVRDYQEIDKNFAKSCLELDFEAPLPPDCRADAMPLVKDGVTYKQATLGEDP